MNEFKNRVFGCAIVKAINANYNADFTHQPRTLPDGTVYATDKAFKYSVRNYINQHYPEETVFFFKRLNQDMNPLTQAEVYDNLFENFESVEKAEVLNNLLRCIDIRFFGATFAAKSKKRTINLSIHGPVQINHGVNRYPENEIYSEQIMSPFRNPESEGQDEREASTLGQQSKLKEGHYVHHFSVNPKNLDAMLKFAEKAGGLTVEDIGKLKEAMRLGVTYYDSAAKAGADNELLFWVQLKPESKKVLPVFTEFISVNRENGKVMIDFGALKNVLSKINDEIEKMEVYYLPENTIIKNLPDNVHRYNLLTGKEVN
ncbi:CRISPR-associated protein TM1801 [Caldithrix abyssi DSM 13497]|uniref:CRISPR-associated protein Csh2 n=1 Tax=Caldithrix abyssi DSM 13497 TaxID=880073 RepID=H1XYR7_CALAY|nr:type I CRISPR-associated protein Cas7 [Caldithrix abyssi]APF20553.1 CRISPR-associated protein Csh2 [Caldithrix abyssi DSM 13497]EHO40936.1 CRISPR-associated protein TM1801 [Caldithrix abyssi DSM 13497]